MFNFVVMWIKDGVVLLFELVCLFLCLCFDCIFIGEVCGVEVFDFIKVWGIGYLGGIGMIYVGIVFGVFCCME